MHCPWNSAESLDLDSGHLPIWDQIYFKRGTGGTGSSTDQSVSHWEGNFIEFHQILVIQKPLVEFLSCVKTRYKMINKNKGCFLTCDPLNAFEGDTVQGGDCERRLPAGHDLLSLWLPDLPPQLWILVAWIGLFGPNLGFQQHHHLLPLCQIGR